MQMAYLSFSYQLIIINFPLRIIFIKFLYHIYIFDKLIHIYFDIWTVNDNKLNALKLTSLITKSEYSQLLKYRSVSTVLKIYTNCSSLHLMLHKYPAILQTYYDFHLIPNMLGYPEMLQFGCLVLRICYDVRVFGRNVHFALQ